MTRASFIWLARHCQLLSGHSCELHRIPRPATSCCPISFEAAPLTLMKFGIVDVTCRPSMLTMIYMDEMSVVTTIYIDELSVGFQVS